MKPFGNAGIGFFTGWMPFLSSIWQWQCSEWVWCWN